MTGTGDVVPDSEHRGLVARLPQLPRDLAQLARFDRPIGWWLLFWPCAWGVWLTGAGWQLELLGWMLLGGAHGSHDSRRQHEAPRRAVRGSSGPLCRAWGSLLQGLPPNPWPARLPARSVQIRLDAHGLVGLWIQATC